ncbi:segregation and condensation protein A [Thermanaerovibrio acidaminovorans]|uniref:Segregation and condensation protein A n=1 Tax=Thermanaerovibrio acidaminovorans (strain ATCC 49978 / DSM 6589 / Su883) TaxID=525903 RepID=D1B9Q6_THEAS|nr:ScpA family protein [Thermanaerovibrio acidaminovorans]ACZ19009.1 chromosome segregation and condensation protein ScpA [Thermanaerovibrio acidaminovorans DSM 6589]
MECYADLRGEGPLNVTLGEFSGPLDLLCQLVERGKLDVARISLVELLERYVSHLMTVESVSLRDLAEFFGFVSRIALSKVRSLFPSVDQEEVFPLEEDTLDAEEELRASFVRYRPIRRAAIWLERRQAWRERFFTREAEEGPLLFEAGDLFGLARVWWSMLDRNYDPGDEDLCDEPPVEIDDGRAQEFNVEEIMEEILSILGGQPVPFGALLGDRPTRGRVIASILALLELCRLGKLRICQKGAFDDIAFCAP